MSERGEHVQRLLVTMAKHADLVAEAFEGSVYTGDKARNAGIDALFNLSVLKPYEEDSYRLNPRLREFISDHLASYQAFQALRRVRGTMLQAREQWNELRRLKQQGGGRDIQRLQFALDESIVEIAYSIEQNLKLLHSLISTQYGNVDDLGSKLRQNRYYAQQVTLFLQDVDAIEAFAELVGDQAIAAGLPHIRQLVTHRLVARRLQWTSQIKDAQAIISKRLFEARLMEARLKRVARFALYLSQNKTIAGWELPVDASADKALFRPERLELRPQPDIADTEPLVQEAMLAAASRMPAPKVVSPAANEAEHGPQRLIEDDEPLREVLSAEQLALGVLMMEIAASSQPVSLLGFKQQRPELQAISDEAWLMFAGLQLKGNGFQVDYVADDVLDPFPINEPFHDVHAWPARLRQEVA